MRLPVPPGRVGQAVSLASDGAVIVAVGFVFGRGGTDRHPAIWRSADGIEWAVQVPEAGFEDAQLMTVEAVDAGFVLVGSTGKLARPDGPAPERRAAVWTSTDGATWTRVPHTPSLDDAAMSSVTRGPAGLAAIGVAYGPPGSCARAVAWTSPDGITWSRAERDIEGECSAARRLVATEHGLLASGSVQTQDAGSGTVERGMLWESTDGLTWQRVSGFDLGAPSDLLELAAGPHGVIAITADQERRWNARLSSDGGRTWTRTGASFEPPDGGGLLPRPSLLAWGSGFLLAGAGGSETEATASRLWASADGRSWTAVPTTVFGGAWPIARIVVHGERLVAVAGSGHRLAAWISPPLGPPPPPVAPEVPVAFGLPTSLAMHARGLDVVAGDGSHLALGATSRPDSRGIAWTTTDDGATWRELAPEGLGPEPRALAWSGSRWVAVGGERVQRDTGSGARGSGVAPLAWTSADGSTWVQSRIGPRVADDAFDFVELDDVISGGPGLVAVGWRAGFGDRSACRDGVPAIGGRPAIWTSPDGEVWTAVSDPDLDCGRLHSVARRGDRLVAVGQRTEYLDSGVAFSTPVAWVSDDGRDWTAVEGLAEIATGNATSVAAGPAGFVMAVLERPVFGSRLLVSDDGRIWESSAYLPSMGPGEEVPAALAAAPQGYLAVGFIEIGRDRLVPAAWTSADGRTWSRVLGDPAAAATSSSMRELLSVVSWTGSSFVALGYRDLELTAWRLTLP